MNLATREPTKTTTKLRNKQNQPIQINVNNNKPLHFNQQYKLYMAAAAWFS